MFWKHATRGLCQGESPLLLLDQMQLSGGCWNFGSVLMEGHVLGKSERAGSILSTGRMGKEDMELDMKNWLKSKPS